MPMFNDLDGKVRKGAQSLTVEIYKYIKDAVKSLPFFADLRDAQKTDLDKLFAEFANQGKPTPQRGLRGEQVACVAGAADGKSHDAALQAEYIDVNDFMEATPVLSKLPKNFYDVVGGTSKWTERKEMLSVLEDLVSGKKLQNDDYLELVKLLKKLLNDTNIPIVSMAIKIFGHFAAGLRAGFSSYTRFYLPTLLDKFKEKKVTVLEPLKTTLDLLNKHGVFSLADCAEDIIAAATSKVPHVRQSILEWVERCLSSNDKDSCTKAFRALSSTLAKACDDSCAPVRDATLKIFARVLTILGEKSIANYETKMDKKHVEKIRTYAKSMSPLEDEPMLPLVHHQVHHQASVIPLPT